MERASFVGGGICTSDNETVEGSGSIACAVVRRTSSFDRAAIMNKVAAVLAAQADEIAMRWSKRRVISRLRTCGSRCSEPSEGSCSQQRTFATAYRRC